MSSALLVSSALPPCSPNFWGSVDLSSSHGLASLRPVAPNIVTALSLKFLLSLSSHRDFHFLLNCFLASYERSVEWTQTFFLRHQIEPQMFPIWDDLTVGILLSYKTVVYWFSLIFFFFKQWNLIKSHIANKKNFSSNNFFWPCCMTCGVPVLRPGMEPMPPAQRKRGVSTTGLPGNSGIFLLLQYY